MKKVLLIVLLLQVALLAKSDFMKMCENPTDSQLVTLKAMIDIEETASIPKGRCEEIDKVISDIESISVFNILGERENVTDLTPLVYFKHLKRVNIRHNDISDLTPLSKLTKLEKLNISNNPITDLTPIKNLKLKSLRVNSNIPHPTIPHRVLGIFVDLSPISKISTLEDLYVYGEAQMFPEISNLVNLKSLSLLDVNISDLCKFKNSKELKELSLYSKDLTSLKCIDNFQKLEELEIMHSPISDLSLLKTLPNLKKLSIKRVPVSDISPLAKVKSLETFSFYETNIKYLSPLKESTSIEYVMNESRIKLFTTHILTGGLQSWFQTVGGRSLEHCSPIDIKEIKAGVSCFEKDGTLKSWWKRMLRL